MVITALGGVSAPMIAVSKAASAATSFFSILDAEVPDTTGIKEPDVSAGEDIILKDVTFAYPSRPNSKILDQINIQFEKSKTTAIVGPSGSGKSTIIGLLQRWYELPAGATDQTALEQSHEKDDAMISCGGLITIGGRNILETDLKWWRNSIGLVQQEPFIFSDTIFNNIANGLYGSRWENVDPDEKKRLVEEACKEAFADEFIKRLPEVCGPDSRGTKLANSHRDMKLKLENPVSSLVGAKDKDWQSQERSSNALLFFCSMKQPHRLMFGENELCKLHSTVYPRIELPSPSHIACQLSNELIRLLCCKRVRW